MSDLIKISCAWHISFCNFVLFLNNVFQLATYSETETSTKKRPKSSLSLSVEKEKILQLQLSHLVLKQQLQTPEYSRLNKKNQEYSRLNKKNQEKTCLNYHQKSCSLNYLRRLQVSVTSVVEFCGRESTVA